MIRSALSFCSILIGGNHPMTPQTLGEARIVETLTD